MKKISDIVDIIIALFARQRRLISVVMKRRVKRYHVDIFLRRGGFD